MNKKYLLFLLLSLLSPLSNYAAEDVTDTDFVVPITNGAQSVHVTPKLNATSVAYSGSVYNPGGFDRRYKSVLVMFTLTVTYTYNGQEEKKVANVSQTVLPPDYNLEFNVSFGGRAVKKMSGIDVRASNLMIAPRL